MSDPLTKEERSVAYAEYVQACLTMGVSVGMDDSYWTRLHRTCDALEARAEKAERERDEARTHAEEWRDLRPRRLQPLAADFGIEKFPWEGVDDE